MPETRTYRKVNDDVFWHLYPECPNWPTENYAEVHGPPPRLVDSARTASTSVIWISRTVFDKNRRSAASDPLASKVDGLIASKITGGNREFTFSLRPS